MRQRPTHFACHTANLAINLHHRRLTHIQCQNGSRNYAIAGVFDATYTSSSPSITDPAPAGTAPSTVKLGSNWRYHIAAQGQLSISERWATGVALGYQFAYDRPQLFDSIQELVRIGGTPFVAASASYTILPNGLTLSVSYQHFFDAEYDEFQNGTLNDVTRTSSADAVTLVLTSTASLADMHLPF